MEKNVETIKNKLEKSSLNLAIVGGGTVSKFFLELIASKSFPSLNVQFVGVCDINPEAVGLRLAREMGIYTTNSLHDLFKIKEIDAVVELTNSRDVLLDLIRLKPEGVAVLGYNIGMFIKMLFEMEQRLKSTQQQMAIEKTTSDFLMQHGNERIVVLNPDFTIVDANEAYLEAVGKSKRDVNGSHCHEITHGLSAPCSVSQPELGCPMIETLRTGESAHVIHEHPVAGDHAIYCDMVTYPLKDENGEIIRIIEIWRDITDELSPRWEKRVKALKADYRKLIQEDRMISLGKLVASSVHEINNPIQGLLTFSHLMLKILEEGEPGPKDLEELHGYLTIMSGELERCGNIISGLLTFSRQSDTEYTKVDLNKVLEEVIKLTRHKMDLQAIRLDLMRSSGPLMVHGDINQLQQCFLNLIFNAIESMPGGGQLRVISDLDSAHGHILLIFEDTGTGIRDKDLDHIFDPFFTTKEEGEGTGLGLSIVYGIVKAHRGNIKVKSQAGKGSSFVLYFPIP
ncbi:MAG: ATP-binding protein [Thermodesulfobacteriota bacterium]|nr:ATP-binding protein [Thermodesulfobacteriota bacterium]